MQYRILRSHRRTIGLYITAQGTLEVRCPMHMTAAQIDAFVNSKENWIKKHLHPPVTNKLTAQQLQELAEQALADIPERVRHFAPIVGVAYGRITIRNQKTRWGSCSTKGNLNFNCLLMLAPPEVRDYVVIHELCHRKEMNHSDRFWKLVETLCPDYKIHRKWLKQNGHNLIAQLP